MSRAPGSTQTGCTEPRSPTPSLPTPVPAVGRTPVPHLGRVNPSIPQRTQSGRSPRRGGSGGSEWWHLPATVPNALQPPSSPPATPTLAPLPPVGACPGSLFLSPHFASWDPEDQIPPACHPHELPGLWECARRSRPGHRGHTVGSCTRPALNFNPGGCAGLRAGARAVRVHPFRRAFSPVG